MYKATHRVDGKVYAIKKIQIRNEAVNLARNEAQQRALLMEARILSKLQHENIVRYGGSWTQTCPAGESDTPSSEMLL